ncbi:HAD family acid phosphatase, partial [Streptomyces sp. 900105245]
MTRRPWARRISVTTVSLAALAAMAAPAEAATTSSTAGAAAKVDYATWQQDCQTVMNDALPYLKERIAAAKPGEKQA